MQWSPACSYSLWSIPQWTAISRWIWISVPASARAWDDGRGGAFLPHQQTARLHRAPGGQQHNAGEHLLLQSFQRSSDAVTRMNKLQLQRVIHNVVVTTQYDIQDRNQLSFSAWAFKNWTCFSKFRGGGHLSACPPWLRPWSFCCCDTSLVHSLGLFYVSLAFLFRSEIIAFADIFSRAAPAWDEHSPSWFETGKPVVQKRVTRFSHKVVWLRLRKAWQRWFDDTTVHTFLCITSGGKLHILLVCCDKYQYLLGMEFFRLHNVSDHRRSQGRQGAMPPNF